MLTIRESRLLDSLTFGSRGCEPVSRAAGLRMARTRGFGTDFEDFRPYQPGDDPRTIDWTINARLGQLVVRVFRGDAHLRVHVLLDTSASMGMGEPDKLTAARKIAAALDYVATKRREAVGLATFDETIRNVVPPASGRVQLLRVLRSLETAVAHGRSDVSQSLRDYGAVVRGPGIAIVVSDFFDPRGAFDGLRFLLYRGLTPAVIQIVAPEELDPDFDDDVELVDVEHPGARPIVATAGVVHAYRARVAAVSHDLMQFCVANGLPWIRVHPSFEFDRLVETCVTAGLLTPEA